MSFPVFESVILAVACFYSIRAEWRDLPLNVSVQVHHAAM